MAVADSVGLWLLVAAMAAGTFALRVSFIELFTHLDTVPVGIETSLRFVPPAVMAALVAPAVLLGDGGLAISLANDRLLAGILGAAVAWRTGSVVGTIVAGMAALWLLTIAPI